MKHLTIVAPNGENNLSSLVGAYKIFTRANEYVVSKGKQPVFAVEVVGTSKEVGFYNDLFAVRPQKHIKDVKQTDFIIIPSLNHKYELAVKENTELIAWIEKQYKNGAEVASICTGAFLLAATGLLTGKSCSTHWAAAEEFRRRFPEINLQPDELITHEQGIYTNGGAYSFLNLILYLVEKFYGKETAIYCSKVFQIDMGRQSQSSFIIFKGQKKHDDDMIKEVQEYMEHTPEEKVSIEELASKYAVSRRTFDRRFMKATGNTPVEYVQRVKMESAKKALESTRKTVNEVMYDVGYADAKAFREVFRKITGLSPLEYRNRYHKESVIR